GAERLSREFFVVLGQVALGDRLDLGPGLFARGIGYKLATPVNPLPLGETAFLPIFSGLSEPAEREKVAFLAHHPIGGVLGWRRPLAFCPLPEVRLPRQQQVTVERTD